ncbi:MAG: hypothetical protein WD906_00305 [Anaerolineales bacterium]
MRRIRNDRLIRRNSILGRGLLFGGLGILGAGFLVSLVSPGVVLPFLIVAVTGMLASQLGIALMSRWSRGPRLDELLDAGLKGLDNRYAVVHYALGAPHALLGPSGIFALIPVVEDGSLREAEGRWTRSLPRRGLLRPARTESLSDLAGRGRRDVSSLERSILRQTGETREVGARAVLVFLSPRAEIETSGTSDPPAVHIKKLKEWIRRQPKPDGGPSLDVTALEGRLGIPRQKE